LSTRSEVLDAGEDTKLKAGEEVKLVSDDDSDEAESLELELKSETRDRWLKRSGDSMWVVLVGYDRMDTRVFVASVDAETSPQTC